MGTDKKKLGKKLELFKKRAERLEKEATVREAEQKAIQTLDDHVKDTRVGGINGRTLTGMLLTSMAAFLRPDSPNAKVLTRVGSQMLVSGLTEHVSDHVREGKPFVEKRDENGEWGPHPGFRRVNGLPVPQDEVPRGTTFGDLLVESALGKKPSHPKSPHTVVTNKPIEASSPDVPNGPQDAEEDESVDNG